MLQKMDQDAKVLLLQNLKYVTLASKSSSKEIVARGSKNSDRSYAVANCLLEQKVFLMRALCKEVLR